MKSPDAYPVWISEVMSQQSTLATVLPYFRNWMQKFPTLEALAAAPEDEVVRMWAGLGYYSRARNLHHAAQVLVQRRRDTGEPWPHTEPEWREVPGVGPYTAAAVTAIALGGNVLPVDGNVLRVLARFFGIPDPLNTGADRRRIEEELARVAAELPKGSHGEVAQAIMELGALVCRPGEGARCEACPLAPACEAKKQQKQAAWPLPKKRKATRKVPTLALVYRGAEGGVLLRKIPAGHRLAGQWELPLWELEVADETDFFGKLRRNFEVSAKSVKHAITHHAYEVYRVEAGAWPGKAPPEHRFWTPGRENSDELTTLTRKILLITQSFQGSL